MNPTTPEPTPREIAQAALDSWQASACARAMRNYMGALEALCDMQRGALERIAFDGEDPPTPEQPQEPPACAPAGPSDPQGGPAPAAAEILPSPRPLGAPRPAPAEGTLGPDDDPGDAPG